ncbi:MAG: response regulator [Spirochaetales bacterium]|nr:response regulator [Spirochaetales bacterium]
MKKSILIIDDDQKFCEEFKEIFEDEGYYVKTVHNGFAGKEILENEIFDILLLDIKIPGLNGFEILEWLKQNNYRIKIMVLTGRPIDRSGYLKNTNNEEDLLSYADKVMNKLSHIETIIAGIQNLIQ